MFDVDDVSKDINRVLLSDPMMAGLVSDAPGLRSPKAFDTFELSVRAIVGQQISVKGASTIMGRIATRYGEISTYGLMFMQPWRLAELKPIVLGCR